MNSTLERIIGVHSELEIEQDFCISSILGARQLSSDSQSRKFKDTSYMG
jgi:hypothetical protein